MQLVVLDLNGILVDRVYVDNRPLKDDADMYVTNAAGSKWEVYFKNNVEKFLKFVFSNFAVAVWTSGQLENVKPITDKLFKGYHLEFLYTQEHCTRMGHDGKKPIFIKDVRKIPNFDPKDVMFIDDDQYKVRYNYPANHINANNFDDLFARLVVWWSYGKKENKFQIPFDFKANIAFHYNKFWWTDDFWDSVRGMVLSCGYLLNII
jgi:hypothetical protein